jgi:hypothetical protein
VAPLYSRRTWSFFGRQTHPSNPRRWACKVDCRPVPVRLAVILSPRRTSPRSLLFFVAFYQDRKSEKIPLLQDINCRLPGTDGSDITGQRDLNPFYLSSLQAVDSPLLQARSSGSPLSSRPRLSSETSVTRVVYFVQEAKFTVAEDILLVTPLA